MRFFNGWTNLIRRIILFGGATSLAVTLATLWSVSSVHRAEATYKLAYVVNGLPTSSYANICTAWWSYSSPTHPCWHNDEGGSWSAVDQLYASGNGTDKNVYWKHYGADASNTLTVNFLSLSGTNCTGVRVQIATTGAVGDFHYLHITPGSGVIGSSWQNWFSVPGYYEGSRDLGTLAATQPTGCAFTGAHFHQSGDGGAGTQIWTHWTGGGSYYGTSNGETFYNWSAAEYDHYVQW